MGGCYMQRDENSPEKIRGILEQREQQTWIINDRPLSPAAVLVPLFEKDGEYYTVLFEFKHLKKISADWDIPKLDRAIKGVTSDDGKHSLKNTIYWKDMTSYKEGQVDES